jgi:hypothetical protein
MSAVPWGSAILRSAWHGPWNRRAKAGPGPAVHRALYSAALAPPELSRQGRQGFQGSLAGGPPPEAQAATRAACGLRHLAISSAQRMRAALRLRSFTWP